MGQRHLGFVLVTLVLVGCKKEPKTITAHHGAFELTLPAGWSSSETREPTFDHFAATPPDGDGMCSFTFTDATGELFAEQYEANFRKSAMKGFGASTSEPDSIEIAGTRFGGAHFKGLRRPVSSVRWRSWPVKRASRPTAARSGVPTSG